ncbi:MAG: glycosyl hydrolase, partial [Thermoguttaceae bacterium]
MICKFRLSHNLDTGVIVYRSVLLLVATTFVHAALAADPASGASGGDLERSFASPPEAARPWVYWFWGNGWLSREGITADLEAMKRAGIGGALIMETGQAYGPGPYRFLSDGWREMWKHAIAEAARVGIKINMHQSPGWYGSGGPWITPELAMQKVVWSELRVEGGKRFEGPLPIPPAWKPDRNKEPWYRDIAVLAFPAPQSESVTMQQANPSWSSSSGATALPVALPAPDTEKRPWIQASFAHPFPACRISVALEKDSATGGVFEIEVSDDGKTFKTVEFVRT